MEVLLAKEKYSHSCKTSAAASLLKAKHREKVFCTELISTLFDATREF